MSILPWSSSVFANITPLLKYVALYLICQKKQNFRVSKSSIIYQKYCKENRSYNKAENLQFTVCGNPLIELSQGSHDAFQSFGIVLFYK